MHWSQELKTISKSPRQKQKDDNIVSLTKTNLNLIKVLISKTLIEYYNIDHDEFLSVNNVLREYSNIKEEFKNTDSAEEYTIYKHWNWAGLHVSDIMKSKILALKKIR